MIGTPTPADAYPRLDYMTTTMGGSGWFAVHVWWNPEGFWEPWDSGIGRYRTMAEAEQEAQQWASELGIEYRKGGV